MPRYVVERAFANGLGVPAAADEAQSRLSVVERNADIGVTWIHSYVSEDRQRSFCVYDGPSPEAIRTSAARNNLPVERITQVRVLYLIPTPSPARRRHDHQARRPRPRSPERGRVTRVALVLPALVLAIAIGGCAVGDPKPTTHVSDTKATLNADIYSSFAGDTTYLWAYGEDTSHANSTPERTIAISDDQPHPVSEPLVGLEPGTTYHFVLCASDEEENPPRVNCSKDQTFETQLLDRANGSASNGSLSANVDASSGPSGEDPSVRDRAAS